jgi:SAM-dependent methyltransferase
MGDHRLENILSAYERRSSIDHLYDPLRPVNVQMNLERTRIQADLIRQWLGTRALADMDVLEIGCGTGSNILNLIVLGADPYRIVANDLIEKRIRTAASRLPNGVRLHQGDASRLPDEFGSFDLIMQFVVFSSILDDDLLEALAQRAWTALRPGGALLSYDFTINNPSNPDVRGISVAKLKALFPGGNFVIRRLTVAPPVARRVSHKLYPLLAMVPLLKTHCLCLVRKP